MRAMSEQQTLHKVREVVVSDDEAGQRIDNYLMRHLKGVPKSRIYRILRKGEVRVNRGRIKPTYRIKGGDLVRIPPVRMADSDNKAPIRSDNLAWLEERVLFEDKRLLALNKPSGLAVHGGSGLSFGVIEALRALRPDAHYLELVHRIDRDTSGCLLIAKKRSALRRLHELLRTGGIDKRYQALLKGAWHGGARQINAPLRKNVLKSGERLVRVDSEGKKADSRFIPLRKFSDATLVEVDLGTGRTHQIRVHAAHIGQPIAGDEKYGDEAFNRQMRERGLKRLFLHAYKLSFRLSDDEAPIEIVAPLEPELSQLLEKLDDDQ